VTSTAYAERHLAAPLRDEKGVAVVVVDMNLGDATVAPAAFERRQIGHMMKLLAAANAEVVADSQHARRVSCIGKCLSLVLLASADAVSVFDAVQVLLGGVVASR